MRAALDDIAFWRARTDIDDLVGNDGATWTFEGRRDGRYHLAKRWNGADGFRAAGEMFFEVAGINEEIGGIY